MSTPVSLFYLRETNHLLAALTRNASDSGEPDEAGRQAALPDGLVLRHLRQTDLNPATPPRARVSFKIDTRHIAVAAIVIDHVNEEAFLSRPTEFSVGDDQPEKTAPSFDGLESLKIGLQSSGVKVTIDPEPGTSINEEIPVWCLVKIGTDKVLVQSAKLPKNLNDGQSSTVVVPFPVVPAGEHDFLTMIRGFQPIHDKLTVDGEERTWT